MNSKRATVLITLLLFCFSVPAMGAVSREWKDWGDGPVKHLMTSSEKQEWAAVTTDAEAEHFEQLFWARRDPSPATPENEHRQVFEQRVAFADANFPEGNTRGAMTDRGMVVILLGVPTKMSRAQPKSTIQSGFAGSVENARGEQLPSQMFVYERKSMASWMGGVEFDVEFVDYYGHNKYELTQSPRRDLKPLLEKAVEVFQVNPGLQQLPSWSAPAAPVKTSLSSDALRQAWETFRTTDETGSSDLHLTWSEYVTPEGETFVPVQVFIPAEASVPRDEASTFFGVVENDEGSIVTVYEEPLMLIETGDDAYLDRSLQLEPGKYHAVFGIARNDEPVAMKRAEIVVEPPASGESVSDLILSSDVHPMEAVEAPMDPYAFGGVKVVPKGDREFSTSEEIWYVIEARKPAVDELGNPNLQIKLEVSGKNAEGKPVRMATPTMPAPVSAIQGKADLFMVGGSFPAGAFAPGSYTLKTRLLDSLTKQSWNFETPFTVKAE